MMHPSPESSFVVTAAGTLGGTVEALVIAAVGVVAAAAAVAVTELTVRVLRDRRAGDAADAPIVTALYARRLYGRVLHGIAPPAVASAITLVRTGEPASAALVLAATALTAAILGAHRHPLHLMPVARYAFNAFVPAAGMGVVLVPALFGDPLVGAETAVAAVSGAIATTVFAAWLETRFEVDAPIRVAVIGPAAFADKLTSELDEAGIRGYGVIGHLHDEPLPVTSDARWLGPLSELRATIRREGIDVLVMAPQHPRLEVFEQLARDCLDLPVRMIEATALYEEVLGHVPIGSINSAWFQSVMHPRYSPSSPVSKRMLDLIVSSLALVAGLPLMLLCALAIRLEDRGPVLYRQRRVGEEGREFDMLKLRTMRPDADALGDKLPEEQLVTRVGRLLRLVHLNELPQLLQVLKGEMTLVGPRPEPPELVRSLSRVVPYYDRRALVKPGITGWAQVRCGYAGSDYGTAWKMCHDLYYLRHRSVRLDLLIMLQTLHALVERDRPGQMPASDFILGEENAELVGR